MKRVLLLFLLLSGAVLASSFAQHASLVVFAASSMTEALTEIGAGFETETGIKVQFQFAGSQILRTQIENGAQADVFCSASLGQYQPLVKAGLLEEGVVVARNRLEVIVPKRGRGLVKTLADLAKPGVKLVLADSSVPAGQYSREVLERLERSGAYGEGFMGRVLKNLVSSENNVRQVALKVQLGEADAGIVYITDVTAKLAPAVIQIAIPLRQNVIAEYPAGALKRGNLGAARAFVAFVRGPGQATLKKWGFLPAL